jgi:pre-rRNA-processing protein IPI1
MPKKKTTKQKDFVRKKLKVGKTKAPANNATNVQFKSQKISLPNQIISIGDGLDRTEEELKIILHSLQHHNDSVRQDALVKMKNLFKLSPNAFIASVGLVSNSLARAILDLVLNCLSRFL